MGIKDSFIYKSIENYFFKNADQNTLNIEAASRKTGSISDELNYQATTLQKQTLKKWVMAILLATDPQEPNRSQLKELYDSFKLDNHLMATIGNRIDAVRASPFKLVDKNGIENTEMTNLFKKLWFIEEDGFIHVALMSKNTGTKVIELYKLKEDGHLKEVSEVDMAHVIPEKGLIVKQPGDTKGWNYKEGVFKDYYLQVGKDKMLGIFAELAPIVLAKKLGVGSWLDYIEKYGIPPIFVFTERFDKKRLNELHNAMLNFKSNHFVIGQGNEKVEIGKGSNTGNSDVFKDVVKLANDEISKRINGGTGTTDEKSHVGAAQVHAENLKTKIKLDKFFIEILVNEELIPRLVKISPVYAGLDNYTFKWDDAETLSLQEFLDYVVKLSANYEFDVKELAEKSNLPITAIKKLIAEEKGEKKKSNVKSNDTSVRSFYMNLTEDNDIQAIDLSSYTKLIEKIAKDLHSGNLKAEDLNQNLINQIHKDLTKASADGWGKDWVKFGNDINQDKTVLSMQRNIFRFSGAKTYAQLKQFNELLYKDGKIRSFNDFKADVLKVNKRYNKNYLQAEYQTARQAGHHGRNWQDYQKDKDLFPNLQYMTVADERVREDHQPLHKVIKPIDDPFWNTFYPPNGWRCRCYVVPTTEAASSTTISKDIISPDFHVNVGKTGAVYSEKHPFFTIAASAGKQVSDAFELSKLHAPYGKVYKSKSGATVLVNPFTKLDAFEDNFKTAKKLADNDITVSMRPYINLKDHKNTEYEIQELAAVRKVQKGKSVEKNIKEANKVGAKIIVFEIHEDFPYDTNRFKSILKKELSKYEKDTFKEVILINGESVERITIINLLK